MSDQQAELSRFLSHKDITIPRDAAGIVLPDSLLKWLTVSTANIICLRMLDQRTLRVERHVDEQKTIAIEVPPLPRGKKQNN